MQSFAYATQIETQKHLSIDSKMALNMDFNALKARTMGSGADEEAVTVDTRGLISKVLARYSGKWFVS